MPSCSTTRRWRSSQTNPSSKMIDDVFLEQPYGIGIKQGNVELKRWVDARLNLMKQKDLFVRSSGTTSRRASCRRS